ncbi:MAG: class I SAM-dependent methyltransferase [Armatimonadota bacterium]|nr:MAG: class I SAM-dependent methyltransferase [Armatimonadota bacterium]
MTGQVSQPGYHPEPYWTRRFARRLGLSTVGYLGLGWSYNRWLYAARKAAFLRAVRTLPLEVEGAAVLELGVGSGFYLPIWRRLHARRIVGVDITQVAVRRARVLCPEGRFERRDLRQPFDLGERFDIVTGIDVLFHVVDDPGFARALENIRRHLRPGGSALVTDCLVEKGKLRADHVRYRTMEEWRSAFRQQQMELTDLLPQLSVMHSGTRQPGIGGAITGGVSAATLRAARVGNRVITELAGAAAGALLYPWEVLATRTGRPAEGSICLMLARPLAAREDRSRFRERLPEKAVR